MCFLPVRRIKRKKKSFNITEVDTGKYAGFVSSALPVTRVFSSTFWGFICDKYGRKLSLLSAGSGLTIATFMFGFSFNIIWAVMTRSMQGIFMGVIIIGRSIIADISDDTNLSTGLSITVSAMNMGYILGPSMAGFLVFPTEKYPNVFKKGTFFDKCKVFLPNFIIAMGMLISLMITFFLLPKNKKEDIGIAEPENKPLNTNINRSVGGEGCIEEPSISEKTPLLTEKREKPFQFYFSMFTKSKYRRMVNKKFFLSLTLYGLFSLITVGYDDLMPVFAATPDNFHGLSMNTSDIGLLYLLTGVSMIVIQFLIINRLMNRFGAKKIFCVSNLLFSAFVFLLPTSGMIKNRKALWVALWIFNCLVRSTHSAAILSCNVFVSNSVQPEFLGLANGLGLSFASIGRATGSVIFGQAYSWSMKNLKNQLTLHKAVYFPVNEYFAFTLMSVSALFVLSLGTILPKSIDKKFCSPSLSQEHEMEKKVKV
ncbi:uncharacterized protein LOC105847527 isoform X2 [Hydra vulgaris]|uniref:uncharacterized protein LOC105847527 isoform X2 n=1 Tax=Hydra vulgaris TaxID=6087 RepID=UPI0032EA650A